MITSTPEPGTLGAIGLGLLGLGGFLLFRTAQIVELFLKWPVSSQGKRAIFMSTRLPLAEDQFFLYLLSTLQRACLC